MNDDAPDVLPPVLNPVLAGLWVLLFGGRWLIVLPLQALGVLAPEQVAALDDGPLVKGYLVLLAVTLLVVALRAVRRSQKTAPSGAALPDESLPRA